MDVANVIDTERWDVISKKNMHFYLKLMYSLPRLYVSELPLCCPGDT